MWSDVDVLIIRTTGGYDVEDIALAHASKILIFNLTMLTWILYVCLLNQ